MNEWTPDPVPCAWGCPVQPPSWGGGWAVRWDGRTKLLLCTGCSSRCPSVGWVGRPPSPGRVRQGRGGQEGTGPWLCTRAACPVLGLGSAHLPTGEASCPLGPVTPGWQRDSSLTTLGPEVQSRDLGWGRAERLWLNSCSCRWSGGGGSEGWGPGSAVPRRHPGCSQGPKGPFSSLRQPPALLRVQPGAAPTPAAVP